VERIAARARAEFHKASFIRSTGYLLVHFQKPPVIIVNGDLFSAGVIPDEKLLARRLETAARPKKDRRSQ
jgi:hypothetical protein